MILILFTTHAPCTLAYDFARQGYDVYEALAISEVLALAEQYPNSGIAIAPEIDQTRAAVIQQHWPTVRLHKEFTALDVSLN